MTPFSEEYFIREIEFSKGDLVINQSYIGDVGHVVWDAAICLSKFIDGKWFSKEASSLNGKTVIELGSGTGLVGLVAAMHGAGVRITDLEELLPLMKKNIESNQNLLTGKVTAETLKWGSDLDDEWKADIILIADCIYYDESLEPLMKTMSAVCHPKSQIFMSYEERDTEHKIQLQKKFFNLANDLFTIERVSRDRQDPLYSSDDIHILKMTPKIT